MAILTGKEINIKKQNYIALINYYKDEIEYNNEEIDEMCDAKQEFIYNYNKNVITNLEMRCSLFVIDQEILDIKEDIVQNEYDISYYEINIKQLDVYKQLLLTKNTTKQIEDNMLQLNKLDKELKKSKRLYTKKLKEIYLIDEEQLIIQEILEEECINELEHLDEAPVYSFNDEKYKHLIKPRKLINDEAKTLDNEPPKRLAKVLQFKNNNK